MTFWSFIGIAALTLFGVFIGANVLFALFDAIYKARQRRQRSKALNAALTFYPWSSLPSEIQRLIKFPPPHDFDSWAVLCDPEHFHDVKTFLQVTAGGRRFYYSEEPITLNNKVQMVFIFELKGTT